MPLSIRAIPCLSDNYIWLLRDEGSGAVAVCDPGEPGPAAAAVREGGGRLDLILLTHHHGDHVFDLRALLERWPGIEVLAHPEERVDGVTGTMHGGDELQVAGLTVRALATPGHTAGMLSLLVEDNVFTGDTLFKNSVGGVRAPGSTSFEDIRSSIMDTLMALPPDTRVLPGHTDYTTIGQEWESNAFIRVWRGLDPEGDEPCTALGEPATLVLWGDDYDGGHKAWIRWAEDGADDIVPGSQVVREEG